MKFHLVSWECLARPKDMGVGSQEYLLLLKGIVNEEFMERPIWKKSLESSNKSNIYK